MKNEGKTPEPSGPRTAEDISSFKWPPFFDPDQVQFLVQHVHKAAINEYERRMFMAILRRAYEDAMELEILYHEIPGVLSGDHAATENFRQVLDRATSRGISSRGSRWGRTRQQARFLSSLSSLGLPPCQPEFIVKPDRIRYITEGIDRISQDDRTTYDTYVNTVRELWQKTAYLDRFYRQALQSGGVGGRDRLAENLRLIARDNRGGVRPVGMDESVRPGAMEGFIPSFGEGRGEQIPGTEGLWPPPDDGEPLLWPPDGEPTGGPSDFCEDVEELCRELVAEGLSGPPLPTSTYATGITSVSAANCTGTIATVTITGSGFGVAQPADVNVLVWDVVAQVVSWSDTQIVVTVPADTTSGCVGFRNETIEAQRRHLHELNQQNWEQLITGLKCLGERGTLPQRLPYSSSKPPCMESNFFAGTLPEIEQFLVNGGGWGFITVEPNTNLSLTWLVRNADTVRIQRTSGAGPDVNVVNPPGNILNLGVFTGTQPVDATYELTATNTCGTVTRTVGVRLRKTPALQIVGIEVIQAIQQFSLTNPGQNNSVPLVANKRTMVRVYIDSGITDGFNNGGGANRQANVTGRITADFFGGPPAGADPLNPGGIITARPAMQISRAARDANNFPTQTLNFELPFDQLFGLAQITARVWVQGHENDFGSGWMDIDSSTLVNFQPRRSRVLGQILVEDDNLGLIAPFPSQYNTSLQGARTRYPIAEDGFVVFVPPIFRNWRTSHDLTRTIQLPTGQVVPDLDPWSDLLDDIDDFGDDYEGVDIWTAVVPNDPRYTINGLGTVGTGDGNLPHFVAQTTLPATFAHEMGHNFAINHANCGAALPGNVLDPRLPVATEDIGMDVATRQLVAAGQAELMCSGGPQTRWPSIAFWNIVFNALA